MKHMRLVLILIITIIFLDFPCNFSANDLSIAANQKGASKEISHPLSEKHQLWLEEKVVYIISDHEKSIFLQLPSDEFREQFIKYFWEARDPTPGTPKNEFKEEHFKRIGYANKFYARDTTRPGWTTDRGRIHILLGEPRFKHQYHGEFHIYPTELWHYISVKGFGLPTSFYLIFFQDRGAGAFRLYSPTLHGIQRLFHSTTSLMNASTMQLYDLLYKEVDPELAHATFNFIPSEPGYAGAGPEPNPLASEMVLAHIEDARNYRAPVAYAEKILANRPVVEIKYSFLPISLEKIFHWSQAPGGDFFLDYGFQINPEYLGMGQYEKKFYSNLLVEGQIKNHKEEIIDTIQHKVDIELDEDKFNKIRYRSLQVYGRRVLIPGNYFISLLVKDNVAKRAMPLVGNVNIPEEKKVEYPYFCPILLADSMEDISGKTAQYVKPFQFSNLVIHPAIDSCFTPNDRLFIYFQMIFPAKVTYLNPMHLLIKYIIKQKEDVIRQETKTLAEYGINSIEEGTFSFLEAVDLEGLNLGKYLLNIYLYDNARLISWSQENSFEIVREKNKPWTISKGTAVYKSPAHKYIMAQQYLRSHQIEPAIKALEECLKEDSDFKAAIALLAKIFYQQKSFNRVVELLEQPLFKHPRHYEFLWLMGHSLCALERFEDSIRYLERARIENDKDINILNQLARIYYTQGKTSKALELISKSLALKPDQPQIISLRDRINKSGSNPPN